MKQSIGILLGQLTITGQFPMEVDGLFLGYTDQKQIKFRWTDRGFYRNGKLYKTGDPALLMRALGCAECSYKLTVSKEVKSG